MFDGKSMVVNGETLKTLDSTFAGAARSFYFVISSDIPEDEEVMTAFEAAANLVGRSKEKSKLGYDTA